MKQGLAWFGSAAVVLITALHAEPAAAQDKIYRCGNEYTNNASIARQRNCREIDGGSVTVVHTRPSSPAPAAHAPRSNTSSSAAAPAARTTTPGPAAAQVVNSQQRVRDNDARAILQSELDKAQERLRILQAEYNDGAPAKTELEESKPELYQARVDDLRVKITRQTSDVQGIERELSRLPGG